jgi:hypothetical protein
MQIHNSAQKGNKEAVRRKNKKPWIFLHFLELSKPNIKVFLSVLPVCLLVCSSPPLHSSNKKGLEAVMGNHNGFNAHPNPAIYLGSCKSGSRRHSGFGFGNCAELIWIHCVPNQYRIRITIEPVLTVIQLSGNLVPYVPTCGIWPPNPLENEKKKTSKQGGKNFWIWNNVFNNTRCVPNFTGISL